MRIRTKDFELELPRGFRAVRAKDVWTAVDAVNHRELTVSVHPAAAEAPMREVLRGLLHARLDSLRKIGDAVESSPVRFSTRGDLQVASAVVRGCDPTAAYLAVVTHERPVLGQRWILSFCVYQHPGAGSDPAGLEAFARQLLDSLRPFPKLGALECASERPDTDLDRVYPYLVPDGYLPDGDDRKSVTAIGHGLYLAFAEDRDGVARILFAGEEPALGAPAEALERAARNLARAVRAGQVTIGGFEGPRGLPVMVFGPEWLASSCLYLSDLRAYASKNLGTDALCASVPHRDALFVFSKEDAAYRRELRALIARNEAGAPKPLTPELFELGPEGPRPFADQKPSPGAPRR